jgi:beta-lactamase regulating signal transducer with metallopeptidase domain/uncharacterized GH25 family protein
MTWYAIVDPAFSGRLCLTLLHSLWQIALLALAAWCVDRFVRNLSVERRYVVNVTLLVAALVLMPITYVLIDVSEPPREIAGEAPTFAAADNSQQRSVTPPPAEVPLIAVGGRKTTAPHFEPESRTRTYSSTDSSSVSQFTPRPSVRWLSLAPWIAALYAAGVVLMLARLGSAMIKANRLGAHADLITDGPLVDALRSLGREWSMKVVPTLARSEQIVVPRVVGIGRATILLPASAISGLTTDEVEMILAHELAHVRRYDMWVNLTQRLAEAVLFFNPTLWYISRRISVLREYCCDETACHARTSLASEPRLRYAIVLLRVAELAKPDAVAASHLAALAATGRPPSEMRRRVARLLGEPMREPLRVSRSGLLALVLLGAAITIGLPVWSTQSEPRAMGAGGETNTDVNSNDAPFEFRLNIVGPNGSPVPNANVEIRTMSPFKADQILCGKFLRTGTYGVFAKADDKGRLAITSQHQFTIFDISIMQPGYGPYWAGWHSASHPQVIPKEFTAELDEGWSVGGVVVDAAGRPLEGVQGSPDVYYKKRPDDTEQLGVGTRIVTDSDGRWRFDYVPASMQEIHISFNHPDYGPLRKNLPRTIFEVKKGGEPTARIQLQPGLTVSGIVTDESGQPISGALVRIKFLNDIREAKTNDQGSYRLVGCEPRMARIVVSAKGRAIDMQEVRIESEMAPVNFSMKPGGHVRVRVVDEQGNGIPKARIFFQRWRGRFEYFEFDHVKEYADENGVWVWNEAPLDEFQADICRPGGMQLSSQPLIAREKEYVFRPPSALVVSGSVVDAVTKTPIETFRVIPGLRNLNPRIRMNWIPSESYEATGGTYRIRLRHDYPAHLVRVEATGYQVAISRDIMTNEGEVEFNFELQPADDIAAVIVTATGEPAANAKIALGVAGSQIAIDQGDIDDGSTYATRLDANADGFFSIPARNEAFQLVITHPSGFAHFKSVDGPIPNRIALTPWARAVGTFRIGTRPAPNVVLSMSDGGIQSYGDDAPRIFTHHDVTTGKGGRFVFERVFPGKGRVGRRIPLMAVDGATEVTSSQRVLTEFIAGKTTQLELGGKGRKVIGKLAPPADYSGRVLWNFALVKVEADLERPPSPTPPADVRDDPDRRQAWWDAWIATDEGKRMLITYEAYDKRRSESPFITASVDRDGSFHIDDMLSGDYVLKVRFSKTAPGSLSGYRFSVPPMNDHPVAEPLELGTLTLEGLSD